ncbi:hypothetical protein MBLNU459_g6494t1 [Dothideomycetes sp. NU459]
MGEGSRRLRLQVLGPAFGLPSVDAQCIAAVALVKAYCQSSGNAWELVASYAPTTAANFPILDDGHASYAGFASIARRLIVPTRRIISSIASELTEKQQADLTALSAFVEANGQPLLDISLYVSFENYRLRTRPAFTKILPWHTNFLLPPQLRASAKSRTSHLGISNLDVDDVHDDIIDKPSSLQSSQKPIEHDTERHARKLLGSRRSIRSMLQTSEHAAAFRLKALADNYFGPLAEFLGENDYLLGTYEPSTVDCLAYGYLSLMLYPDMPQTWLASTIRSRYPRLADYIDRLRKYFGVDAEAEHALNPSATHGKRNLPWTAPQSLSALAALSHASRFLTQHVPFTTPAIQLQLQPDRKQSVLQTHLLALLGVASTALALFGYWAFHNIAWPHGEAVHLFGRKRLTDYGAAGAALSALGALGREMQYETAYQQQRMDEADVRVDVVVDEEPRVEL